MKQANTHNELQEVLDSITQKLSYLKNGLAFKSLASTNEEAINLASAEANPHLIMAQAQSRGRGRHGRRWLMQEGDIALSVIIRPPYLNCLSALPMMPALALIETLASFGITARLKWPNDIIIAKAPHAPSLPYFADFRKIAGILVENSFIGSRLSASIIGIGVNIKSNQELKELVPHAASLSDIKPDLHRDTFLEKLLSSLDKMILRMEHSEYSDIVLEHYSKHCETLGRHVVLTTSNSQLVGEAIKINNDGSLVISDGQKTHNIYAGDVDFLSIR